MEGASKASSDDSPSPLKQQTWKRHSLFGDELLNFDPSELEDDNWRDVFDEPDPDESADKDFSDDELTPGAAGSNASMIPAAGSTATGAIPASSADSTSAGFAEKGSIALGKDASASGALKAMEARKPPPSASTGENDDDKNGKQDIVSDPNGSWQNAAADKHHRDKLRKEM